MNLKGHEVIFERLAAENQREVTKWFTDTAWRLL